MAGVLLPGSWGAEIDGLAAGALVDLGELVAGCGEAELEAFDLASRNASDPPNRRSQHLCRFKRYRYY